jgi:histidine triad (HIT) family protein
VAKEIPAKLVFENEHLVAFHDIHPKASVHVLVIPKKHIDNLGALQAEDAELMGHLTLQLTEIAEAQGLKNGFRTMINTGPAGGQEVYHLHYHILGDRT